ncbi:MAG: hypothetical protein QG583_174 [Patescibacteria group bacterium]|nr:hypothetical protein [Patescibacteria group bacterium]
MDKLIHKQKAFSTIELMIALAIMSIVLTGVVLVSFGNQSALIGSQTSNEAMKLAQGLIEEQQALARKDFNLVNSNVDDSDPFYKKSVSVKFLDDFSTKEVEVKIEWNAEYLLKKKLILKTLITNFTNPIGNNTCDSTLTGDEQGEEYGSGWKNPEIKNTQNKFADLVNDINGIYPVTDVDAYYGKLYVTVNNISSNSDDTFFIFDINKLKNNQNNPLIDSIDNSTVSAGLNAVVVAGHYAYVANGYGANFTTCIEGQNCAQLQIFDLNNLSASPINFKVPGVGGNSGQSVGNSIFYKDGFIFLGLSDTGGNGSEFHIIDVHDPENPFRRPGGTFSVGNAVNTIYVKNKYVYLGTVNNQELMVLSLNDLSESYGYDASGNAGNGKSLSLVGDNLYLGRTIDSGNPEFYVLDNTNPEDITGNNLSPSTFEANRSVNGLLVRDFLAFLLTNNQLRILDLTQPLSMNIPEWTINPLTLPLADTTGDGALDCEGNFLYAVTNYDNSDTDPLDNNGLLYVISTDE